MSACLHQWERAAWIVATRGKEIWVCALCDKAEVRPAAIVKKDEKVALLGYLISSVNDGLRDLAHAQEIDDNWLRPIREFRQLMERERAYLHGDEDVSIW